MLSRRMMRRTPSVDGTHGSHHLNLGVRVRLPGGGRDRDAPIAHEIDLASALWAMSQGMIASPKFVPKILRAHRRHGSATASV